MRVETNMMETRPHKDDTMPLSAFLQKYRTGGYMVQDVMPQMQGKLTAATSSG